MKRGRYILLLILALLTAFQAGRVVAAWAGSLLTAGVLVLFLVFVASLLLPGPPVLWVELLGTASIWPVIRQVLPPDLLCAGLTFLPPVLLQVIYGVLSLLIATLGPMLLLFLWGDWLDGCPRPKRGKGKTGR